MFRNLFMYLKRSENALRYMTFQISCRIQENSDNISPFAINALVKINTLEQGRKLSYTLFRKWDTWSLLKIVIINFVCIATEVWGSNLTSSLGWTHMGWLFGILNIWSTLNSKINLEFYSINWFFEAEWSEM